MDMKTGGFHLTSSQETASECTQDWQCKEIPDPIWLVVSNIFFHHIWDVILPIDFHIFQRGSNHQPAFITMVYRCFSIYPLVNSQKTMEIHHAMNG